MAILNCLHGFLIIQLAVNFRGDRVISCRLFLRCRRDKLHRPALFNARFQTEKCAENKLKKSKVSGLSLKVLRCSPVLDLMVSCSSRQLCGLDNIRAGAMMLAQMMSGRFPWQRLAGDGEIFPQSQSEMIQSLSSKMSSSC